MSTLEQLLEQRKEIDRQIKELGSTFFNDKSLSLDERWAEFVKLSAAGALPEKSWICHSIDKYKMDWYSDFYMDRHEVRTYAEIAEAIEEDDKLTPEQFAEWKEVILAAGNGSFCLDW